MPGQKSKSKKMAYVWTAFLTTLSNELKKISNQVRPKKAGGRNRQDSDLVWDALEFYFEDLKGEGTVTENWQQSKAVEQIYNAFE